MVGRLSVFKLDRLWGCRFHRHAGRLASRCSSYACACLLIHVFVVHTYLAILSRFSVVGWKTPTLVFQNCSHGLSPLCKNQYFPHLGHLSSCSSRSHWGQRPGFGLTTSLMPGS